MSATPYGPLIDPIQPVMAPVPNIDPHLYYATETIRKIQEQYDRLKYQLSQKKPARIFSGAGIPAARQYILGSTSEWSGS